MNRQNFNRTIVASILALALGACGGGGGGTASETVVPPLPQPAPVASRLVAEIIAYPAQAASSPLKANAGYAGNLPASYAIQAAGNEALLDLMFVMRDTDGEAKLIAYAQTNAALLRPGTRVLVADEVYWNGGNQSDEVSHLEPQMQKLKDAIAVVRKHLPQVKVGITLTPYAAENRPNTLEYSKRSMALVDWVGTDPYWFGGDNVAYLNNWSRDFPIAAKAFNPNVETWYIAQAFKLPEWDTATYNAVLKQQLAYAKNYDHVMLFGWQFVSEIDHSAAGMFFTGETRALYSEYLK